MNILFLTLLDFKTLNEHNIYTDLLRKFVENGHFVYVVSPTERKNRQETKIFQEENTVILKLKIGNVQKTNIIEKGISTITLERKYIAGIKKNFSDVKFDLILYSTPPITFEKVVRYIKEKDYAQTYLLLKDIFPQNSVDMGMISQKGVKAPIYWYFRRKEKKLYAVSDYIGCMSQANAEYLLLHNPEINKDRVEICPNSVEVTDLRLEDAVRNEIRKKYGLPIDKKVFVYGGNLGIPQNIPFIIQCLKKELDNQNAYFLIVGDGTAYKKLEQFFLEENPQNMKLLKHLPKKDYDMVAASCDVGLIFLDHRFTIPNFPSRILSYMQAGLPILACTDENTDVGKVITDGGFGWWCKSERPELFENVIQSICCRELKKMGQRAFEYLKNNYDVEHSYRMIVSKVKIVER